MSAPMHEKTNGLGYMSGETLPLLTTSDQIAAMFAVFKYGLRPGLTEGVWRKHLKLGADGIAASVSITAYKGGFKSPESKQLAYGAVLDCMVEAYGGDKKQAIKSGLYGRDSMITLRHALGVDDEGKVIKADSRVHPDLADSIQRAVAKQRQPAAIRSTVQRDLPGASRLADEHRIGDGGVDIRRSHASAGK